MNAAMNLPAMMSKAGLRGLAVPMLIVMILAMMVLPLPPFLLDILFTFNIAMAIMVLLVTLYTVKPLEFSVFPTVLLVTTLLRLSLNVASTRVVLLHGHSGPDAAGKVIESFGHFLVGGNYAVGLVVFIILVVINFIVITKGAGRIAEVSARFTLDAMPGKQMAIDADLNAGLIGEEEAKKRRTLISEEADFFGSMDGASKFVRGDAIAGILILFINVLGGLIVGVLQHNLSFANAAQNYTLLAIGDGLVAQIPALVISVAAGIAVSRVSSDLNIGQQLIGQLFSKPQALVVTAAILMILGLIPGMPHIAFLLLAIILGAGAYTMSKKPAEDIKQEAATAPQEGLSPELIDASWDDVTPVDQLGLEVGYRLIPLVDKAQDGELLRRIKGIRRKFAQEIGFLPPAVHIRDNLQLRPSGYRVTLKGVDVGQSEVVPGMFMAINPGHVTGTLPGAAAKDPAFGLPATWIDANMKEKAQSMGYTVVDASTVVATHLNHLLQLHAADILGRQEVQQLLDHFTKESPKAVEDLIPKLITVSTLQKILQNLLSEGVHIRDMRTILETLAEHASRTQDANELTAMVRIALGRAIVQQYFQSSSELQVMALNPGLENILMQAMQSDNPDNAAIEPGLAESMLKETQQCVQRQEQLGLPAVLLVPAQLRNPLARFLRRAIPHLRIISHAEVPDSRTIKVTSILGARA